MNRILSCFVFSLSVLPTNYASAADEPSSLDYNLSMAGALINDWCGRNWQNSDYLTIHACNYQLAQRYNFEISEVHFSACANAAGGDIVQIADCMVAQFGTWLEEDRESER